MLGVLLAVAIVTGVAPAQADCGPTPYDCAVAQVQRQEFPAAITTLTQILTQSPSNLKALNLMGIALTGAGRAADANQRFKQALTIDPNFYPARKNLAVNEFNSGQLAAAQHDFEQVLTRAPDDEITHLHLGEIAFQRKQLAAALPHYEKAHDRVFETSAWTLHYATCLLANSESNTRGASMAADAGRASDAHAAAAAGASAVSKGVALLDRLPKNDAAAQFDGGMALGQAGAYAEAARFFGAARSGGYKDAYAAGYNQALMLLNAGDAAGASLVATEMLTQPSMKRAELYSLLGQAYEKTDRVKEAYDALREATRLEPNNVEHYVDLAMICIDHQNFDLGIEIVDIGLKYRPDAPLLYLQRGVLFAMKGMIEQAANEFARASAVAPDDPVPYVAQAMTWMQTGQASKAVEVLRGRTHARASQQQDAVLFYALGVALLRAGASPQDEGGTEATNAFATAVKLNPEFPQARAELGKLLVKRGEVDEAIPHLEKAVALDPENAAPAYVLAQAYRKRGEMDRARELLAKVSTINTRERGDDPDHELKRVIIHIVREGATAPKTTGTQP